MPINSKRFSINIKHVYCGVKDLYNKDSSKKSSQSKPLTDCTAALTKSLNGRCDIVLFTK